MRVALLIVLSIFCLSPFAKEPPKVIQTVPAAKKPLVKVNPSRTCMIKNYLYKEKQKAIPLDGKTYYACCLPCERTLTLDEKSRWSEDPVTGEKIDKAKAVVAADKNGRISYFKNEKTLARQNLKLITLERKKP